IVEPGVSGVSPPVVSRLWLSRTIVKDRVEVEYLLAVKERVRLSLFDVMGRRVDGFDGELVGKGRLSFDTSQFGAGAYFLKISCRNKESIQHIVVVK
ncbi:hypothetical protein DRP53_10350, partial [candidate division WOR-3 bacterium]